MKRLFDLLASAMGLLLLAVPLALLAWQVRRKLGSPVLFTQVRPGLHGKPFRMVKFRTMTDARDASGALLPDAQRLTPFGRFLRASSLDELPELWNVLRGEMSLVGPRPLLMEYLPLYSPEQARRHEGPVVRIQRDQIRHGSDRNQVQKRRKIGPGTDDDTGVAQMATQRHQHVEDHAHAGQRLAGEGIATDVGVHQRIGRRQPLTGQMVVGDQHFPAQRLGRRHAGMAGNAVVDGDQQARLQVRQVEGPAQRAGIVVGDVIIGVAGAELGSVKQLQDAIGADLFDGASDLDGDLGAIAAA